MKFATFLSGGRQKIGLVHSDDSRLFDLAAASDRNGKNNPAFASMLQLIDAGSSALDEVQKLFDQKGEDETLSENVSGSEILAPIPEPRQMRDGMSFPLHILQAPRGLLKLAARAKNDMAELARLDAEPLGDLPEIYRKQPIYYITNRISVRGTNTTVKWPRYSQVMDYELEFVVHHLAVSRPLYRRVGAAHADAVGDVVDRLLAIDLWQIAEWFCIEACEFGHIIFGA